MKKRGQDNKEVRVRSGGPQASVLAARHAVPIGIVLALLLWLIFPALPVLAAELQEVAARNAPGSLPETPSPESPKSPNENRYSFEFRGEPLQKALEMVARVTETDMVFDPEMVGGDNVYKRIRKQPMPGLLSDLLAETGLDYIVLSSGTVVIVRKVAADPAYGTLSGVIRDRQTGKPLHGATVLLAAASGGTSTNRQGSFTIGRMMSGSYRIIVSYIGYEPVEQVVEVPLNGQVNTAIALEPTTLTFSPVIVRAHRSNLAGIDNRMSFQSVDTRDISGGRIAPIRSLSLFSGLQYGLPMQDIHLQGGRQGEHRIRLDGMPVYNPHHSGHFYSAFSPLAIGGIQLHKAGFGAEQGSMIAGIIDFHHDLPHNRKSGLTIHVDPLDFNVRGDLAIPVSSEGSTSRRSSPASESPETSSEAPLLVAASFRTNFWNWYREPVMEKTLQEWDFIDPVLSNFLLQPQWRISEYQSLQHSTDIRYLDGHVAAKYDLNDYNTFRASLYIGQNRIHSTHLGIGLESGFRSTGNDYLFTMDEHDGSHITGQVRWDVRPGPRWDISAQAGISTNRMDHHYHMNNRLTDGRSGGWVGSTEMVRLAFEQAVPELPSHTGSNRIDHGLMRTDVTYSLSPEVQLETGVELNLVSTEVDFSDFFYRPVHSSDESFFSAFYFNYNRRFNRYWQVTAGSRFTYAEGHSRLFPEPRFSLQYDRVDSRIGYWTARVSGGRYHQFVHQYEITNAGPTSLIPAFTVWSHSTDTTPPRAYHISGSWIYKPASSTSLKLVGYYKWEPEGYVVSHTNLMSFDGTDRGSSAAFSESSRLRSRGVSARLQQDIGGGRIKGMLGYDYSHAEMRMSQFGRTVPAPWNEPHRIQARTVARVNGPVSVIANWKSVLGRAWGFRKAYYDYLHVSGVQRFARHTLSRPEDDRLSAFHQLDLSLLYRPSIGSVDLDLRLDLINVLNRRNVLDWSLSPEFGGTGPEVAGSASQDYGIIGYEKRNRTMPGFYPLLRVEVRI
ncbi:TonB-dependent receptor [Balneolales bacterium ANBcel1]|nr:TonB-dependent receptor [Balneolales bacterium ANBcel1]